MKIKTGEKTLFHQEMDTVKIRKVIVTTMKRKGTGESESDPIRIITEIWDMKGNLIASHDPYDQDPNQMESAENPTIKMLVDFYEYMEPGHIPGMVIRKAEQFLFNQKK